MTGREAAPPPGAIESYLAEVAAALPGPARARGDIVAELRGGLLDTIDAHRSAGLTAGTATDAALREFGHPRQLASAFGPELAASQARRVALTLVATGPLIGLLWAAAAMASHIGIRPAPPWQWPGAPAGSLVAFPLAAAALTVTVWAALFTVAATGRLARWIPAPRAWPRRGGHRWVRRHGRRRDHPCPARQPAVQLARNARPRTHRRGRNSQPDPAHPRPAGRPPLPGGPRRAHLTTAPGTRH